MIKNEEDFKEISKSAIADWNKLFSDSLPVVTVGTATCGRSAGSLEVLESIKERCEKKRVRATIFEVGCIGLCYSEPLLTVFTTERPGVLYGGVKVDKIDRIVEDHLIKNKPIKEFALGTLGKEPVNGISSIYSKSVLRPQVRRVLKRCGIIDPTNIYHYLANNGYSGLLKALGMNPKNIIEEVKRSGLRGRGGAGFPTGIKWEIAFSTEADKKYIVCNADEGDPGAFMNRSVLESDTYSVIEGMTIAGYAIGATVGYIYCRAEYPLALERLRIAIKNAEEYGLLGENILGTGFSFEIKIKEGAGAFVCGEETALIASIEGQRGMPSTRPPYPAVSGLWGKPTIINNVETLVSVSLIFQNGAEWFAECGTENSKGTKTFALAGKINNTGLIEVPLGIKLRDIIFDIGGGILNNKNFKAVQTGGPSGGCIPESLLDLPVDYDSLKNAGAIMGSGGMIVMDEETCMVDIARYFLDFTQKESCGECVPCRLGTKQMLDILNDIVEGKGNPEDIDMLEEIAMSVKMGSLCGLGQTAPNPVLTTIRYFRNEYEEHINEKKCSAKVCKALIYYMIIPERCTGCHLCYKVCPSEAIVGNLKEVHKIIQEKCIRCGLCFTACPDKIKAIVCIAGQPKSEGKLING